VDSIVGSGLQQHLVEHNLMNVENIGIHLTFVTAILVAYFTYRNQLRLKSYELLLGRLEAVLKDIENLIKRLVDIKLELDSGQERPQLMRYKREFFDEALILYHKVLSSHFGPSPNTVIQTY
jgi:hypothetical protein